MPYSGINDPDLPERIQKMPDKKRRAFVQAFNSSMEGCKKEPKDCEKSAFAIANSAANEADEKATKNGEEYGIQMYPEEAGYNPVGMSEGRACANCRWFMAPMSCYLVSGIISPTGISDFYLANNMVMDNTVIEPDEEQKAQIKDKNHSGYGLPSSFELSGNSGFKVLSDEVLPGTDWLAWFTNAYQDNDGEIFETGSLSRAAQRFQKGEQPLPPLWFWHMGAKTQHGQSTWIIKAGRFLVAGGVFDNSPLAQRFKQFYEHHPMQLSHGFEYSPADFKDGVYSDFKTFEISTIPKAAQKAANPWTAFIKGDNLMQGNPINPEQAAYLTQIVGEEAAKSILDAGEKASEELDKAGVAYKESEATLTLSQVKQLLILQKADDMSKRFDKMEERMAKMEEKVAAFGKPKPDDKKPDKKKPADDEEEDEKSRSEQAEDVNQTASAVLADYAANADKQVGDRHPLESLLHNAGFGKFIGGE